MTKSPTESMLLTLIKTSYYLLILVVLTYYFYPVFLFISLIYLFFIMIKRIIEHFNSKYLISDEFIQMQTGSFSSELSILKKRNIDSLALNESWIERKFDVATLK